MLKRTLKFAGRVVASALANVLGVVSPTRYIADAEYRAYVHRHRRFAASLRHLAMSNAAHAQKLRRFMAAVNALDE